MRVNGSDRVSVSARAYRDLCAEKPRRPKSANRFRAHIIITKIAPVSKQMKVQIVCPRPLSAGSAPVLPLVYAPQTRFMNGAEHFSAKARTYEYRQKAAKPPPKRPAIPARQNRRKKMSAPAREIPGETFERPGGPQKGHAGIPGENFLPPLDNPPGGWYDRNVVSDS